MDNLRPIFLLGRHGRTAGNENDVFRGWSNADFAQLDENGRNDAREQGIFILGTGLKFPIIITDDLDRTGESAAIVASVLGIKDIIKDKRLRPVNMGEWTGKKKSDLSFEPFMKDKNKRIPGGETLNEFNRRQSLVFADIAETIAQIKKPILVIGHGSNAGYLFTHVNKAGDHVGYEGLTEPGGVMVFTKEGITPIFKKREQGAPKPRTKKLPLVQLSKWSIEFVGGKETNDQPKACQNCHLLYSKQKTCSILGPDIIVDPMIHEGKLYTPVCGEHDAGIPMEVLDDQAKYDLNAVIGPDKADAVGLEWAEGRGTNCGGANDGAPCKYFDSEDGKDGVCLVLKKSENTVDWDDCCSAHDGPSMAWRDAQKILKENKRA